MADVEGGVALFEVDAAGVLNGGDRAAADRGGVIDGVAVLVEELEGDALLHALAGGDDELVEAGLGLRGLVREGLGVGRGDGGGGGVGGGDDVEVAALGAVVADVQDDAAGKGALDVEVVDLDVAETVVLVYAVGVLDGLGGAVEAVRESQVGGCGGRGDEAAGVVGGGGEHVVLGGGERGLEGEGLGEGGELAGVEVDAVAGADHGFLQELGTPGHAEDGGRT